MICNNHNICAEVAREKKGKHICSLRDPMRLSRALQNHKEPYGTILDNTGPYGTIWNHIGT